MSPEAKRDPNKYIRKYVEKGATNWEHQSIAQELYQWADVFRLYFFKPKADHQPEIPNLLVGIEPMRVDVLAGYHLKENAIGLPYEITFDARYIRRPLWELLETELHEMVHLYQENTPGLMPCKGGYHNAQFVLICEELGLHPAWSAVPIGSRPMASSRG